MRYFVYCRKSQEDEDRQVQSIPSQRSEVAHRFAGEPEIITLDVFEEEMSAKYPGRPVFSAMLDRVERGEADGLIAWHPDRLARNAVDGGRVVHLLDTGALKDLKFVTYTFENNSQGKFMLQIMFAQSKHYSDALSDNVKRGNRMKLENGWRPNFAPYGYLNERTTKTIVRDPTIFPLIRQMFELMLTGAYSANRVARMAREEWGLRTPKRKRSGGALIGTSTVHRILTNPFYAGVIAWNGEHYAGKHEAVVTMDEFEAVQQALRKRGREKPQRHRFAYTGLIRCGSCGLMVTAEHKTNRHGSRYLYYHCSKRMVGPRCREQSVSVETLEAQIAEFLAAHHLEPRIASWIEAQLALEKDAERDLATVRQTSLERSRASAASELRELTSLRTRDLIDDAEFVAGRARLQTEIVRLDGQLANPQDDRFEPLTELVSFSTLALKWFLGGDDDVRRLIVETVGSNPTLAAKKLSIQAAKPFVRMDDLVAYPGVRGGLDDVPTQCNAPSQGDALRGGLDDVPTQCNAPSQGDALRGGVDHVRTSQSDWRARLRKQAAAMREALDDPACAHIIPNIRTLRDRAARREVRDTA